MNAKQIKDKLQELQVSWDDLVNKAKVRKKNLDLSVQIQRVSSSIFFGFVEYVKNISCFFSIQELVLRNIHPF